MIRGPRARWNRGVTLITAVVTLAILAVIAALVWWGGQRSGGLTWGGSGNPFVTYGKNTSSTSQQVNVYGNFVQPPGVIGASPKTVQYHLLLVPTTVRLDAAGNLPPGTTTTPWSGKPIEVFADEVFVKLASGKSSQRVTTQANGSVGVPVVAIGKGSGEIVVRYQIDVADGWGGVETRTITVEDYIGVEADNTVP